MDPISHWIPYLNLLMYDYEALVGGKWITDSIINAGQKLLQSVYPLVRGLQVTTLGEVLAYRVERQEFVQILHVSTNHWLTCSTIGCEPGVVNIFDSMSGKDLPTRAKEQITSLVCTPLKQVILKFMRVQRQKGCNDCGVFALAFATTLCSGECPTSMTYNQKSMRKHLLDCFVNGKMETFPTTKGKKITRPISTVKVNVICNCRQPEDDWMVQCDGCEEWFHKECENIPSTVWSKKSKWLCSLCA